MSRKRMDVDMGTMALPVGEGRGPADDASGPEAADPLSVSRFRQAMDQPPRPHVMADLQDRELPSPFTLLGAPEPAAPMSAQDIGAMVESLWTSDGASGVREVRMTVHRQILPDTSVRLYEARGRLQVDLSVTADATRLWLASALPALAGDLGMRLSRPVRVAIVAAHGSPGVSCDWPEGVQR